MVIDLDNNATTKPAPEVVEAVTRAMTEFWRNPSSVHRGGQEARRQVELARASVARLVGVDPKRVTFTSGGTEAIDLAVRGVLGASAKRVVVTTAVEHSAVRELLDSLEKAGRIERRLLPLDRDGVVIAARLEEFITPEMALVSVQWANNETGVVQPVSEIAAACRGAGVVFHCDGTQMVGKEVTRRTDEQANSEDRRQSSKFKVQSSKGEEAGPDVLTFSAHKFHGPKGVGVVCARSGVRLAPVLLGTQEGGRRGGTENVPGIVGAGVAAELAMAWLARPEERRRLAALRDRFERAVLEAIPGAVVNGTGATRLWNTTNIAFPRLEAEALLLAMSERGLYASAGAACSSGSLDPSPVLLAMGVPPELAHGSVRFSLSRETSEAEVEAGVKVVVEAVRKVGASAV
ncbi:MAG: cysteine desulfurase family protein [Phycisphaerales bacterium]